MRKQNLQLILDKGLVKDRDICEVAKEAIEGGVSWIQFRDKVSSDKALLEEANNLRRISKEKGCILIINDRVDVALASEADGVHLGQEDLPYEYARKILGRGKIIGISTHDIEQARSAQLVGADYIGIGPIFATPTKPGLQAIGCEIVSRISKEINIPAFFIGGISLSNLHEILMRGGDSVAIASAILESGDIAETTGSFVKKLREPWEAMAI